ncbi:restriction endonuclease subunit S [Actinobacillus porcinus]|uniref:restriction endonuclease subunit S n=1 Tax=Actinobacillus porcinus TaxID=51048 RepID=UPI002A908DEB|nr:restriction endonuclease subunit S [Actinobacillus porcinus]MDY6215225.1 restriction endonuclease subunit S [Actinobacillus porcinus]
MKFIRLKNKTYFWEQRKLGEIVEIVMGQSPNSGNYTNNPKDHILVQGNADIKNGKVFPRIWTTQITKIGKKNDLIMSVRAPVGDMAKTDYDVVLGRGVCAIKGNEFIYQILSKMKIDGYWNALSTGSTFDAINSNDIKKTLISIPKEQEEQTAIGNFFKQLDDTIALHRRNCIKFQNLKVAYLESIFSAKYIQNKDKNKNAWEQRKLGELVEFFSGLTYSPQDITDETGVLVLRSSNVQDNRISSTDNVYVSHKVVNVKNVQVGDIIVVVRNGSRNLIGKHALINNEMKNTVIGAFMTGIRSSNSLFINALLNTPKFISEIEKNLGATINQITIGAFKSMEFNVPTQEEQTAIGNFFKQLDDTIALHQRFWVNNNQFGREYAELF